MQGIMLNPANAPTPPPFSRLSIYHYYNGLTFPNISSNRMYGGEVHPVLSKLGVSVNLDLCPSAN